MKLRAYRALAAPIAAAGIAFGTVAVILAPREISGAPFVYSYLIVANAFLIFLLIGLSILYMDVRRGRLLAVSQSKATISRILQHILEISRARTSLSAQGLQSTAKGLPIQVRAELTSSFLKLLVNETRSMFEAYVGHTCAVSIKLLVPGKPGVPDIRTFIRDDRSWIIRSQVAGLNDPYPFDKHSPFVDILKGVNAEDYYLNNDLRSGDRDGRYTNGNPRWREFYDATLIVPIASFPALPGSNVAGFLCVDSLTGTFDRKGSPFLARIAAGSAFLALYELSLLENTTQQDASDVGAGGRAAG